MDILKKISFNFIGIFSLTILSGICCANGTSNSPPMGWNSWNTFGKNINESLIINTIDAMVKNGLRDSGYVYVVIDGGWKGTKLRTNGGLSYNEKKFPKGMKFLADYAHLHKMKLGLHLVAGTDTCTRGAQGSYGNENQNLKTLKKWGIDFVKIDKCINKNKWTEQSIIKVYSKWGELLNNSGITYSMSAYKFYPCSTKFAQMARTTEDISAKVDGLSGVKATFDGEIENNKWSTLTVMEVAHENNKWAKFAGDGYWNDPDMLTTGDQGLSVEEQKSQFALWSIMTAPLFLGNNPMNMSQKEKSIIMNKIAIKINQDITEQGRLVKKQGKTEVWLKHLKNNQLAILLLNRDQKKSLDISYEINNDKASWDVFDIYNNKKLGVFKNQLSFKVLHDSSLFLLLMPKNT